MNIFATRTIQYRTDAGEIKDVILTVFEPVPEHNGEWQCAFQFHPPENQRKFTMRGQGWISAFIGCLSVARGFIEHPTQERTSWQGMMHSGLPWHHEKPEGYQSPPIPPSEANPGNLEILTKVRLGIPHDANDVHELILIVYRPLAVDEMKWKCAFAFGEGANEPVRYGIGADSIEALLDALALARITYESMIPNAWKPPESDEFDSVEFWPYKIGRAVFTEPAK
ncbi:MAG TPA: hypothetical protein PK156_36180 [Polyangium sp.]|nr:hypothetical protein [Polyangium sp.]